MERAHVEQPKWYVTVQPPLPEMLTSPKTSASQEIPSSQETITASPEAAGLSSGIGSTSSASSRSESEDEEMETSKDEDSVIFQRAIQRHKELKIEKQRVQLEAVRSSLEIARIEKVLELKKQHYYELSRREDELTKLLNWCSEL